MKAHPTLAHLLNQVAEAMQAGTLVKLTLSKPTPAADDLKSIDIRPILIKRELKLSFTYHHKTRDIVKNYPLEEACENITRLLPRTFTAARLGTTTGDVHLAAQGNSFTATNHPPATMQPPVLDHNRAKQRVLESKGKPYLHALGLTDPHGTVLPTAQDKFKQINKYIEILDGLIKQLPPQSVLNIVDMGSGKGYLTFALYDHMVNTLHLKASVIGVETRPDMVKLCNDIAKNSNFTHLKFVENTIAGYDCSQANIVIALHACDTATDDALAKAVQAGAALIVVAPCCHKQIRRDMPKPSASNPLTLMLQYGTYVERMAEMLTDSLRAQLLQLHGYATNVFEFIGGEHTPKNVMIVATRLPKPISPAEHAKLQTAYSAAKIQFGVVPYLEKILKK